MKRFFNRIPLRAMQIELPILLFLRDITDRRYQIFSLFKLRVSLSKKGIWFVKPETTFFKLN